MIANPDETKNHYKAMKLLDDLAYSKEFLIEYKLNNGNKIHNFPNQNAKCYRHSKLFLGECVCFDNTRVLHGRKGFVVTGDANRLYQGGYVAWDEIRSRMNVIKHKKHEESPH